jgi:hypothetical protein
MFFGKKRTMTEKAFEDRMREEHLCGSGKKEHLFIPFLQPPNTSLVSHTLQTPYTVYRINDLYHIF